MKPELQNYIDKTFRYHTDTPFFFGSNHPASKNGHYSMSTPAKWLNNFYKRNKEELIANGVNHKINVHGFRHTYVSWLQSLDLDPNIVMNLTRHANYKTTLVYTHLDLDILKNKTKEIKKELDSASNSKS